MIVPLLLQSTFSLAGADNELARIISTFAENGGGLRDFAFRIFELAPSCCLDMALSAIETHMKSLSHMESVTSCLEKIVVRFVNDGDLNDKLCLFMSNVLHYLTLHQSQLSHEVIINIAVALASIGTPTDDRFD